MDKVYLTSDQYVVKLLEEKEQEIVKLNEKYDDLLKRFVALQAENKKLEEIKEKFELKRITSDNGYGIYICGLAIDIQWDGHKDDSFQKWLDLLGLELPKGE